MRKIYITPGELDKLELAGLSEQQIADNIGCSRRSLYLYRKRINCPQKQRACLKPLKTVAEKRETNRLYQRTYQSKPRNGRQLRKIALQALGRRLKPGEVIHHIDRNPKNNQHNNLVICTQSYHMSVLHVNRW